MTSTNLRLDDQLCFALYAATNAVVRAYRPLLQQLGLTYPQYLVLMMLWEGDDVPTGQVAQRLQLPVHGVIPVLRRLEQAGLVERRRDPDDARVVRVRLTPEGSRIEIDAAEVQARVVCATGLDPDALAALRGRLQHLAAVMADGQPDPATAG